MKDVYIFNSLTNKIDKFVPLKEGEVSMYVCGPTVYGDAHVGNIRPVIFFDSVVRFLTYLGYKVYYVSNYTDVDDKIINRSAELGISEIDLANKNIEEYEKLLSSLRILKAYDHPRVTNYMDKIIAYIDNLVKNDKAYVIDGDVFFRVSSVDNYGMLSNNSVDDLRKGARIEKNDKKEDAMDFTLWKRTEKGINWDSPWSKGRPGWHTECCVMINTIFGPMIDIHGGGFDLKFPHHENEIAQSEAHDHTSLARYWIHNGFVNFGNEKMSKSLGNLVLAKDAIAQYGPDAIRYLILSTYYRSPVSFTEESATNAKKEVERLLLTYKKAAVTIQLNCGKIVKEHNEDIDDFLAPLCQDLGFSNAITVLNSKIKEINQLLRGKPLDVEKLKSVFFKVKDMLYILGLDDSTPLLNDDDIALYNQFQSLRKEGKYEESDKLRPILMEKFIL